MFFFLNFCLAKVQKRQCRALYKVFPAYQMHVETFDLIMIASERKALIERT